VAGLANFLAAAAGVVLFPRNQKHSFFADAV
jgi:hypothetical protein